MRKSEIMFLAFSALHDRTTKAIEDYIKTHSAKAKRLADKLNIAEMEAYHQFCEALMQEKMAEVA